MEDYLDIEDLLADESPRALIRQTRHGCLRGGSIPPLVTTASAVT